MFSRILIATRGEIALRIIRACKELGIETVVVYSEADRDSIYRRFADETICIGPSSGAESYLNIPSIIAAAEIADVEAIHPGYGFLSEMSHFAEVCQSSNIGFVGPSPKAMELMGDKSRARKLAEDCGVPIVAGSDGKVETEEDAVQIAHEIGFPVMIKASAGGGGRGMRVARNDISLRHAFNVARAEAEAAFDDGTVYVEKLITEARHVEMQILGDHFGNIIALGERDCSLQRRHQKLIEESPCPSITKEVREHLSKAAVGIATAAGYYGAGTVEFLVDKDQNFFFIEMNCRIQVEHPVTEMVTGIDIIKEQLRIASGHKLRIRQEDVEVRGVAIECRINAEDPKNNFKPSPGKVATYFEPGGPGVRVDSHLYSGYVVPSAYDSLVAKLIVHRGNRREAVACMKRALEEYVIEGIQTTIPLYLEIFGHSAFLSGKVDTNFIDTEFSD